jgi:hypothetical protein
MHVSCASRGARRDVARGEISGSNAPRYGKKKFRSGRENHVLKARFAQNCAKLRRRSTARAWRESVQRARKYARETIEIGVGFLFPSGMQAVRLRARDIPRQARNRRRFGQRVGVFEHTGELSCGIPAWEKRDGRREAASCRIVIPAHAG